MLFLCTIQKRKISLIITRTSPLVLNFCTTRMVSRSQICVDFTIVPSGKLIVRGVVAGRTFFILGVFFMIITDVAPVSATACVIGIDGFLGCTLDAHIC